MHHHSGREEDTPVSVPGPILGWPRRLPVPPISSDASTATTTICSNPPAVTIQSINRTQRKHAYAQHSSLLLDKCLCRWPRRCPLTRGLTTAHGRGVRVTITRAADSRRYGPRASQDRPRARLWGGCGSLDCARSARTPAPPLNRVLQSRTRS